MMNVVTDLLRMVVSASSAAPRVGLKTFKYFIDSMFREKVVPLPGSVLYCDLWLAVEHSGIYVGEGRISNIVVDGLAESTVCHSSPENFTSKSTLGRRIYVSCDDTGPVGNASVAFGADSHVGTRSFYGLIIKNCHQFSGRCVAYSDQPVGDSTIWNRMLDLLPDETWEPTLGSLKAMSRKKMGVTKWRLWDWDNEVENNPTPEPDWQQHEDFFRNQVLDEANIRSLRAELLATRDYMAEISDEDIPGPIRERLQHFLLTLETISQKYEEVKDFLSACCGSNFSYSDLEACGDDFSALVTLMQNNTRIQDLVRKMGREYISEERKASRIPEANRSEVYGMHRSDDLMRMLPSELLNLEDPTLESLFYARLLEKNLLSYELQGVTYRNSKESIARSMRTGPVVACLDTSASMQGAPLRKAKALLLAIAKILKQENRSLHVLLFGAEGEICEFSMAGKNDSAGLLKFLQQGFGGGTNFETPLQRGLEIIATQEDYIKADVLMISDGDCLLTPKFSETVRARKASLDCIVYSILCAGERIEDTFSDEVVVL